MNNTRQLINTSPNIIPKTTTEPSYTQTDSIHLLNLLIIILFFHIPLLLFLIVFTVLYVLISTMLNKQRILLDEIPRKKFNTIKTEISCCYVCLEHFLNDEYVRLLECEHMFHDKCIDKWLDNKMNCPTCRKQLVRN